MITQAQIRGDLASEDADALPLWDAIAAKAAEDHSYAAILTRWLADGGTVILRDDLCVPLKDLPLFVGSARRYPWFDAFAAIDTAHLHVSMRE